MRKLVVTGNTLTFAGKTYRCAIGKGGITHNKKEGDGCTPAGEFLLRECWYRADKIAPPITQLPLHIIQESDKWCDDVEHELYNRHFILPFPSPLRDENLTFPSPLRGEGQGGGEPSKDHKNKLLPLAKALRNNMTEAEKKLWYHLRAHRFQGYSFRQQHIIGERYVADFICLQKKLIIELDGGQHNENTKDLERDAFLQEEGFRVLRFWNNDVFTNLDSILETILLTLQSYSTLSIIYSTPSLPLPPQGGVNIPVPKKYESLWRDDSAYDIIVPLGYNDSPIIPGKGSAIFLHCAKENYRPTEGCVALEREDLLEVITLCDVNSVMEILPSLQA